MCTSQAVAQGEGAEGAGAQNNCKLNRESRREGRKVGTGLDLTVESNPNHGRIASREFAAVRWHRTASSSRSDTVGDRGTPPETCFLLGGVFCRWGAVAASSGARTFAGYGWMRYLAAFQSKQRQRRPRPKGRQPLRPNLPRLRLVARSSRKIGA